MTGEAPSDGHTGRGEPRWNNVAALGEAGDGASADHRFCLEWGSQIAGRNVPAHRSRCHVQTGSAWAGGFAEHFARVAVCSGTAPCGGWKRPGVVGTRQATQPGGGDQDASAGISPAWPSAQPLSSRGANHRSTGTSGHCAGLSVLVAAPQSGSPFYSMRFVHGRTLVEASRHYHQTRQAGEEEPLGLVSLLSTFVAVCNTVAYAIQGASFIATSKGQMYSWAILARCSFSTGVWPKC